MKLTALFLLTFALMACDQAPQEPTRSTASASSVKGIPSKWSQSAFPLNLKISTDFNTDELTAVQSAALNWGLAVDSQIDFFNPTNNSITSKSSLNAYNDSTLGVYKITSWPNDLPTTALAVTQIYGKIRNAGSSSEYIEIRHADVLMNYDYYTFKTGDDWGYDLGTVVLHELGHFLGLYHSSTSSDDSVMYPTISRYTNNIEPLDYDISAIKNNYRVGSTSDSHQRSAMSNNHENDLEGEEVVIHFELRANGTETIKIKSKNSITRTTCKH